MAKCKLRTSGMHCSGDRKLPKEFQHWVKFKRRDPMRVCYGCFISCRILDQTEDILASHWSVTGGVKEVWERIWRKAA